MKADAATGGKRFRALLLQEEEEEEEEGRAFEIPHSLLSSMTRPLSIKAQYRISVHKYLEGVKNTTP
jgi:hypothetical protein